MKRTISGAILGIGVLFGLLIAASWPERVVEAQRPGSAGPGPSRRKETRVVGTWLGTAKTFQMTRRLRGVRFAVVVCKR